MFLLQAKNLGSRAAGDDPYPSWPVIAATLHGRQDRPLSETRTERETRLWAALAAEPSPSDGPSAYRTQYDGNLSGPLAADGRSR